MIFRLARYEGVAKGFNFDFLWSVLKSVAWVKETDYDSRTQEIWGLKGIRKYEGYEKIAFEH